MTTPNTLFYDPRPQFEDANGAPLDLGSTLTFYSAGTTTPKAIYADSSLNTPLNNPLTLDAGGYVPEGGVWLAEGSYKLVVKNSLGATEWTQDNIAGAGLSGGGSAAFGYVDSIEELRNITAGTLPLVYVSGYYGVGTGGNKFFYFDANSTATDDGGAVIAPQGTPATGRWLALWASPFMTLEDWGCQTGNAFSNASAIENMIAFANANPTYECVCTEGEWYLNGNVDFSGDISVTVRNGCRFRGLTGVHTLTFSCTTLTIETREELAEQGLSSLLSLIITTPIEVYPKWWGAVEGVGLDSSTNFNNMIAQTNGNDVIIDIAFFTNDTDFTNNRLVKRDAGLLELGDGGVIVGDVTAEGLFFTGNYDTLTFNNVALTGDWFDFFSGVNITKYGNWVDSLASNGSHVVTWIAGNVVFTNAFTNNNIYSLRYKSEGTLFTATGFNVRMPKVDSKVVCFDNTSTGEFNFGNGAKFGVTYLSQFGALVEDASTTRPALLFALKCGAIVDLDGEAYKLDEAVDATVTGITSIRLQNGSFVIPSAFNQGFVLKVDNNAIFNDISIYAVGITGQTLVWQVGTNSETIINGGTYEGDTTTRLFYDQGTTNTLVVRGAKYGVGLFDCSTRLSGATITGCVFDDTSVNFTDPDNITITGNDFSVSTNRDAISMIIPNGQTADRAGFVVNNNVYRGLSRDKFLEVQDGNSALGENYHMQVEGNIGTDVSTTYEFTETIDLSLGDGVLAVDTLINDGAMTSSGFFRCTQFNWGSQALGVTTAYVNNVECEYFDSTNTTGIALLYRVTNSAGAGSATITCSFRRTL